VAGDAQRLQQIVWNLLSNSVKFTPRGGRVQVRLTRVHSHVEITVSDTGEGIPPEFLPKLFQRFTQADSTFTRAHGGLGLGLAITRHLVEAHGGRIEASSPGTGQGTTMRVELPAMIVHDPTLEASHPVHPTVDSFQHGPFSLPDLSGVRVLLVDDDADALQMAKDVLVAAAATAVTASSAAEALAALDGDEFDVAVLDIGMPGVDGYELLRRIRERPVDRQGGIPAAALTAYARAVDRTRSLTAGFQMHLSKPVDAMELAATILSLSRQGRHHTAR
jgi:CheY-like chemotaxis protein